MSGLRRHAEGTHYRPEYPRLQFLVKGMRRSGQIPIIILARHEFAHILSYRCAQKMNAISKGKPVTGRGHSSAIFQPIYWRLLQDPT